MTLPPKPAKYAPRSTADLLELVRRHPLAWVVSAGPGSQAGLDATLLPLRPVLRDGALVGFHSHLARSNPQLEWLRRLPRALLLFKGLDAYVSPSWLEDHTQAPTWNYESAAFDCDLELDESPATIDASLEDLVNAQEQQPGRGWSLAEMGERRARLARGVVMFRAHIRSSSCALKLGQDETAGDYHQILAGLRREGQHAIVEAMLAQRPDGES